MTPSEYDLDGKTYNISCAICYDGSITSTTTNGVTPFTYLWENSATAQNRTVLAEGTYKLTVTDDNGCKAAETVYLDAPERTDWQMTGNTGSNPATNFIGTSDNVDLSFRTNNTEALRIKADGKIKISSLIDTIDYTTVLVDAEGQLLRVNPYDETLDAAIINASSWLLGGNNIAGSADNNYIGTKNSRALIFKTNTDNGGAEWMRITPGGKVAIGTSSPSEKLQVADGSIYIQAEDNGLIVDDATHKRVGFMKYTGREAGIWRTPGQDFEIGRIGGGGLGAPTSFLTPDLYVAGNGKIGMGVIPTSGSSYRLFVEDGIVTRDVKVTAATTFPDYVFETDYKPMSIYELEHYIKQNKHLPEIPSAKEIEKNEGFELGDMQIKLLKKIEEQTLYIIDLQKQVDELKMQMKIAERK